MELNSDEDDENCT